MSGLIIIIILIVLFGAIYWLRTHPETVQRYLLKKMLKHAGFSTSDRGTKTRNRKSSGRKSDGGHHRYGGRKPIIPPEYAQDVEYTETRTYSSDTIIDKDKDGGHTRLQAESQVSDVEWVEIKDK